MSHAFIPLLDSHLLSRAPTKAPALHKVIETFEGHEQRLNYRSITFEAIEPNTDAPGVKQQIEHPRKMTQKFDRQLDVPADEDLRKRTFCTGAYLVCVQYHISFTAFLINHTGLSSAVLSMHTIIRQRFLAFGPAIRDVLPLSDACMHKGESLLKASFWTM